MNRPLRVWWWVTALVLGLLYAPLVAVVVWSFNRNRYGVSWSGWTVEHYLRLLDNPQALQALLNSLWVACGSTLLATVLGTMTGYGLSRTPRATWLGALLELPLFVPDIVLAVSLLLWYALLREWVGFLEPGIPAIILSHVTFQLPFVAIVVRARRAGLDAHLEEAARDLGADGWQTFRHVTVPLLRPAVIAGALLAFTLSLDDFVVSFFIGGPGSSTVPVLIYGAVKRGLSPEIHALSTLIILASLLAVVGGTLLSHDERQAQSVGTRGRDRKSGRGASAA